MALLHCSLYEQQIEEPEHWSVRADKLFFRLNLWPTRIYRVPAELLSDLVPPHQPNLGVGLFSTSVLTFHFLKVASEGTNLGGFSHYATINPGLCSKFAVSCFYEPELSSGLQSVFSTSTPLFCSDPTLFCSLSSSCLRFFYCICSNCHVTSPALWNNSAWSVQMPKCFRKVFRPHNEIAEWRQFLVGTCKIHSGLFQIKVW